MKRPVTLFAALFIFLAWPFLVHAQSATPELHTSNWDVNYPGKYVSDGSEQIAQFLSDITVKKDGSIAVSEKIMYDFGSAYKHGIYRNIPLLKTNSEGKKFIFTSTQISVTDENGKSYRYSDLSTDTEISLKIGDPNKTITGVHVYDIQYDIRGALTYFSDHDELYWNATGNQWAVPIRSAQTIVHLPSTLAQKDIRIACFTGAYGVQETACKTQYVPGNIVIDSKTLAAEEGLTVVVGFPKGIVVQVEPKEYKGFFDRTEGKILLVLLAVVAFVWYILAPVLVVRQWFLYGRDPKAAIGVATAWFDVPKTQKNRPLTPGESGTLVDERADMQDISATIVHLAQRGYLKIIEVEKNTFALEKQKDYAGDTTLLPFEQKLLQGIFATKDYVKIEDAHLYDAVSDTKKQLYESVFSEGFFPKNPETVRTLYTVLAVFALCTGNILLFIVAFIFGRAMPRKTLLGVEQANIAKSLKNFLVSQERQFTFQAKNQLLFEKFLPYAVAFGVERIWALRFRDIAMKAPTWYQGYDSGTFNSYYFANSLNTSFSGLARAATPTSSSSGFSSGFSGGGFSGGGGGGGGGGSW